MSRGNKAREFIVIDAEGVEHELPTKFEVCDRCEGKGTHVNPSVDEHGISPEEFREDPDFEEAYFGGVYDVACYDCGGERVVRVVDETRCQAELLKLWDEKMQDEADYRAELAWERRMGY